MGHPRSAPGLNRAPSQKKLLGGWLSPIYTSRVCRIDQVTLWGKVTMRGLKLFAAACLMAGAALVQTTGVAHAERPIKPTRPEWQNHIDWSIGYSGAPDCPDQYARTEPHCLNEGNRSCLMRSAIQSAKRNNCAYAMRLTLITQCHNPNAQRVIVSGGEFPVCQYLKRK